MTASCRHRHAEATRVRYRGDTDQIPIRYHIDAARYRMYIVHVSGVCVCVCVCAYCVCVCVCVCVFTHTHTHTYIHITLDLSDRREGAHACTGCTRMRNVVYIYVTRGTGSVGRGAQGQ